MSFEAFIQCFKDGETGTVSCQRVREAFEPFVREGGPFDWRVYYDEQNYSDVILERDPADQNLLKGFTVDRPCGDERLWDSLLSVLRLGNLVLYFPSNCPPLIADNRVAQHLPPSMIEALGQPRCVSTGKEIVDAVRGS